MHALDCNCMIGVSRNQAFALQHARLLTQGLPYQMPHIPWFVVGAAWHRCCKAAILGFRGPPVVGDVVRHPQPVLQVRIRLNPSSDTLTHVEQACPDVKVHVPFLILCRPDAHLMSSMTASLKSKPCEHRSKTTDPSEVPSKLQLRLSLVTQKMRGLSKASAQLAGSVW